METQRQNQAKTPSASSVAPVQTGLFQSRPFNDPEQEAAEALASSHQSPDLQTQIDTAARLGHNFSRVQVQSNTPTVIQPQSLVAQPEEQQEERETDEMSEPVKLMAPPILGKPIQREAEDDEPLQMRPQLGFLTPVIQREADEDEPIQMMPQWGWLQRLPQEAEADEEPIQMMPQLGLIQRQEAEADEEPVQMMPQLGLIQRQEAEVDEEPIQMKPQLGLIQRQQAEADEEPIQMKPQLGFIQRQQAEADEEPIQMQRIQLKVVVGQPGDKYEQEADSVAAQVMSMSVPPAHSMPIQRQGEEEEQEPLVQRLPLAASITPLVQRQQIETTVQPKCSQCEQEEREQEEQVQTKPSVQRAATGNINGGSELESQLSSSKGGGSSLPDEVRSFMEPRFGADFSSVRVHTDSTAVQMNKELRAQAFAHGSDIYYGAGKSPGKDALTAHELTHTIQQTGVVRLNKEVRRQPKPEEQEQQPLQAKELGDRTPEVSLNKELRLQPIEEQEEQQPLQAKQLGDRTPEVSPNKELRLQPIEEQEEAEPLQAKELPSHNPELSLNKELQRQPLETANPVIQAKALEGGFTPSPLSIQRGLGDLVSKGWNKTKDVVGAGIERGGDLLSKGKDLLKSGLDWVKNNIIQPLTSLASSGWSAVKNFGSQISTAFKQANPTIWDVFQPEHLMFRMASNQRKQLFAQAIQAERSQQAQAAAGIQSSGPAPVTEPSQLERLNGLAETIESGAGKVFDIRKEILEGAVLGDFKENPTTWNTIGQVAIGFVPFAGQAADIRDIIANVKKLHETGYKDPDAWISLGLTAIGIIPGVGDAIKAAGKGSKGAIRKALSGVLKNADNILRPVLGKAKGLLNGAGRYGKQFLGWASGQGARLRQGVTRFAESTANFAKAAGQRAQGLVTALQARIGGFVNGAVQKASDVVSQGRGLLGKAIAQFMGMAKQAFDAVQSRVSQAVNLVKAAAERGKDIALKVGRKIADTTQKATTLLREFTQSAIQKGRQALQTAKQWSSQQIKKATELGRRLVTQARKRVADLVRNGVKLAKEKAIPFIKQKLGGIKQRILGFLKDRWNRLKEKLGIKKSEAPNPQKLQALNEARQWAGRALKIPEEILKDLSLEAIERLKKLSTWAKQRLSELNPLAMRKVLGCASPCKVDLQAIKEYLEKGAKGAANAKRLSSVDDVIAALPKELNAEKIKGYLNKKPALMEAIRKAKLTDLDFAKLADFMTSADKTNYKTAYQTFTRYLTSVIPAKIGPNIEEFNKLAEAIVKADPRQGAALKGPMFESFVRLHVPELSGKNFGRVTLPGSSSKRTVDLFDSSKGEVWEFKHQPTEVVPQKQVADYQNFIGEKTSDGVEVKSINYLFATQKMVELNEALAKVAGFTLYYIDEANKMVRYTP